MLGSIDCMHWEWRNCLKEWHGQFARGLQIINDLKKNKTVLNNSSLFGDLLDDIAPVAPFEVNGVTFKKGYYLADGIYPQWSSFVKSFSVANSEKNALFKRKQESARKDIERAFGVLQGLIEVALLFQAAGQKPDGSLKAPQSATPTGHYDVSPEQLADMTCEHDFVKGLTEKLKTNPKKGIPEDESNILNTKNLFGSNTYPQKKGRSLGYFLIFLLDAYWNTTLVILMVATAFSLPPGRKSEKGNLYFCFPYLTVQVNTRVHDGRGHTALTSECGSMLEEVLAITRGLHDVRKEASALHSSLMGDLSNASSIATFYSNIVSHKMYLEE
ncbi:ALP1-like protein isoform X1 [Tanacetum coccineum]